MITLVRLWRIKDPDLCGSLTTPDRVISVVDLEAEIIDLEGTSSDAGTTLYINLNDFLAIIYIVP